MNVYDPAIAVQTQSLVKKYHGQAVLRGVSLSIPRGGIFGLLGPNGAGKTTLLKTIAGLVRPTLGTLAIFGREVKGPDPAMRRLVGLIPQDNNLERELSVEEALVVYGRLFGLKRVKDTVVKTMERFSLLDIRHKQVRTLSGGMMRRVLIARTLLADPELILLDEPTVGLDPDVRQSIWDIMQSLQEAGKTLVFTTHYMEEAERLCDHIAILQQGTMFFSDTKEQLQARIGMEVRDLENLFIELARNGGSSDGILCRL